MNKLSKSQSKISSAYAIFEGGGARGIAHVGALKALEESGKAIIGAAGTSAGAIIAALVAVGYQADEIFESSSDHILSRFGYPSPVQLFQEKQWDGVKHFKKYLSRAAVIFGIGQILCGISLLGSSIRPMQFIQWEYLSFFAISGLVLSLGAFFYAGLWAWQIFRQGGVFESKKVAHVVNEALKAKLAEHYEELGIEGAPPDRVLFKHIDPRNVENCVPLKIVTTNVTKGELVLFDERNADVCVADVVAASAALPVAFRPTSVPSFAPVSDCHFTDGGLVSNLPSWVFREEKKARERLETAKGGNGRIPIYAFSLSAGTKRLQIPAKPSDDKETNSEDGSAYGSAPALDSIRDSARYVKDLIFAGIFGSQSIIEKFVTDLRVVPVPCDLDTIEFDCSGYRANKAYLKARIEVGNYLLEEELRETLTQLSLNYIAEEVASMLDEQLGRRPDRLRVALIDPVPPGALTEIIGFQVSFGSNMEADADDRLDLDVRTSIAANSFHEKKAAYGASKDKSAKELRMTKYERALLPPDIESVITLPVYAKVAGAGNPQRVLAIDSSSTLKPAFDQPQFMKKLQLLSADVSKVLIDRTVREYMGE